MNFSVFSWLPRYLPLPVRGAPSPTDWRQWSIELDPPSTILHKQIQGEKIKASLHRILIEAGIALTEAEKSIEPQSQFALLRYGPDFQGTAPNLRLKTAVKDRDSHLKGTLSDEIAVGICCYLLREYLGVVHIADVKPLLGRSVQLVSDSKGTPDFYCIDWQDQVVFAESKGTTGGRTGLQAPLLKGWRQVQNVESTTRSTRQSCGRVVIGTSLAIEGVSNEDTFTVIRDPEGNRGGWDHANDDFPIRQAYAKVFNYAGQYTIAASLLQREPWQPLANDIALIDTSFRVTPLGMLPTGDLLTLYTDIYNALAEIPLGDKLISYLTRALFEFSRYRERLSSVITLPNGVVVIPREVLMETLSWTPWHHVVALRDDLRSGALSLASFAADLYEVAMQKGQRPLYEDPAQFFALTYPTYNLRELAKDVVQRLAGKNQKAVRQLELTYGGGKTHTLITLYHLVNDPAHLPTLPAVQEFIQHIGMTPPQARVALLPFDKLDVEKGMEVRGPNGDARWLKQPWSVLAYQIAGDDGLRLLHAEGEAAERETAPAENLLVELLRIPERERLSILILIDEVLMYAREKVGQDPVWRARLLNFFQYLTQAVTKVDHCALVASLLATDPRKSDSLGKELTQELYAIFRREREEGVQPVLKEDVAEVLRRRFFTPESVRDREAFRPHVVAALKGITALDEQTAQEGKSAEARFLLSYPFHPDLTDIFYTKWTNLEGFQRTRGVLRTFALALRDAEPWDTAPLIGANVFLTASGAAGLSEAARELTGIAATEEYEGKHQDWSAILLGELEKVQEIQQQYPGLAHREVEQAVFATFLHSQPVGQKARTRDLFLLLGQTRPDKIELEKALHHWVERSWFLDEETAQESGEEGALPRAWRLGSRPNLTQMHHDACQNRVPPELVDATLLEAIDKLNSLTAGAKGAGARVHVRPKAPGDVDDDGEFRYVILGTEAACEAGAPSALAQRFLTTHTTPNDPRVNKNAVVLVAPSLSGLEQARQAILHALGWQEVQAQLKQQQDLAKMDPLRWQTLLNRLNGAQKAIPGALRQAYTTVIAWSARGDIEAFKVTVEDKNLFEIIKADKRARIQETAISAEALLPGGPYELWRAGETSRWLKDLVGAFAEHPHLPKMLNRQAILDTLIDGCVEGAFVFQLRRPDGSLRTFWRYRPEDAVLKEPGLEVVLPETATLSKIATGLLAPGVLPGLWEGTEITLETLYDYFVGGYVVEVQKAGYTEPVIIPAAPQAVINEAVESAVQGGKLWLLTHTTSLWNEPIPPGLLAPQVRLLPPPTPIPVAEVLPSSVPEAWDNDRANVLALSNALANRAGKALPWPLVRNVVNGALKSYLELAVDSGPWPCDYPAAQHVKLQVRQAPGPKPIPPKPGIWVREAELTPAELQDLADEIGEVGKVTAGYPLKITVRVEIGGEPPDEVVAEVKKVLGKVTTELGK